MSTILYATDLIFSTRIGATARAHGEPLRTARGLESLRTALAAGDARQVIVDLDADEAVAAVEIAATASPRVPVLAYVSHVRADLAEAARNAGADVVMARSAFVQRLDALLAPAAPTERKDGDGAA